MLIGVPKEIKDNEFRVGLTPSSVAELVHNGHKVLVQTGTSARLSGWKTKPAEFKGDGNTMLKGFEIVATGLPPWRVTDTDMTMDSCFAAPL